VVVVHELQKGDEKVAAQFECLETVFVIVVVKLANDERQEEEPSLRVALLHVLLVDVIELLIFGEDRFSNHGALYSLDILEHLRDGVSIDVVALFHAYELLRYRVKDRTRFVRCPIIFHLLFVLLYYTADY
jgi:hypothetical protein